MAARKVITALFCDLDRVDRARRGARSGGAARRAGSLFRGDPGDDRAPRRHRSEVRRRRGDGRLRDPARPRGRRAARRSGGRGDQPAVAAGRGGARPVAALPHRNEHGPGADGRGQNSRDGDAVNVAARLEQAARPGEILLGSETLGLVRDAVEVEALEPLDAEGQGGPRPGVPTAAPRSGRARVSRADSTSRSSVASSSSVSCGRLGPYRRRIPAVSCSRCWARPASGNRDSSMSCSRGSASRRPSFAAGACTMARASRSGRSPRR